MIKQSKILLACIGAAGLLAAGNAAYADNNSANPSAGATTTINPDPNSNGKTSDRTPGNPSPDRTPNASSTGAVGTDTGKTTEGTSDRTPHKDSGKSMD